MYFRYLESLAIVVEFFSAIYNDLIWCFRSGGQILDSVVIERCPLRKLNWSISNATGECVRFLLHQVFFVPFELNSPVQSRSVGCGSLDPREYTVLSLSVAWDVLCGRTTPSLACADSRLIRCLIAGMFATQELVESPSRSVRWPFGRTDTVRLNLPGEPTCFVISSG